MRGRKSSAMQAPCQCALSLHAGLVTRPSPHPARPITLTPHPPTPTHPTPAQSAPPRTHTFSARFRPSRSGGVGNGKLTALSMFIAFIMSTVAARRPSPTSCLRRLERGVNHTGGREEGPHRPWGPGGSRALQTAGTCHCRPRTSRGGSSGPALCGQRGQRASAHRHSPCVAVVSTRCAPAALPAPAPYLLGRRLGDPVHLERLNPCGRVERALRSRIASPSRLC